MTSRIRRIVLAMYGHQRPAPVVLTAPASCYAARGCYEAMDDVDPIIADLPRSPIAPGNYGMPCA